MYYTNKINFTFKTAEHAERAKNIIADTLRTGKFDHNKEYHIFSIEELIEGLKFENNTIITPDGAGYFTTEGCDILLKALCMALAENLNSDFAFDTFNENDYTELCFDGGYKDGVLSYTSTYWPSGYMEYLMCPECGEDVVLIKEYNPNETYICPECGEEINLEEIYKESAPQIIKEEIRVS